MERMEKEKNGAMKEEAKEGRREEGKKEEEISEKILDRLSPSSEQVYLPYIKTSQCTPQILTVFPCQPHLIKQKAKK